MEVVKATMSLERLKNYRAYLVGEENRVQDLRVDSELIRVDDYQKLDATLRWYHDEIESVDAFIDDRLEQQVRDEQQKAAREWLLPKKRSWWKRLFDGRKGLGPAFDEYTPREDIRAARGAYPPYSPSGGSDVDHLLEKNKQMMDQEDPIKLKTTGRDGRDSWKFPKETTHDPLDS